MKRFFTAALALCFASLQLLHAQTTSIDRGQFFTDTSMVNATIVSNMSKLFSNNKQGVVIPASFVSTLPDGTNINEPIQLQIRGHFRHDYCYVPPVKVIFKNTKPTILASLKSMKLVNECKISKTYEQYLLKEFIIYKIYNLISDMSFRVRLLNITFQDSLGKKKPITEHAFFMEEIKDLAKRNGCEEWRRGNLVTEATNRKQMTVVAIFEYMIGNTDWAVPVNHNIRLIASLKDSSLKPFAVPYDFDYSGFVNTEYAVPDERLEIENVRQRLYRGFPRTMSELNEALEIFNQQKGKIYSMINNFDLLIPASKKDLIGFLNDFYDTIKDPQSVKSAFIDNARTK
jgi:hypothetical protein